MNNTDIQTVFAIRRADALAEYREIILRNPKPSNKDIERVIVLGGILGCSGVEIQRDMGVSETVEELKEQADKLTVIRKQEEKANEDIISFDKAEEKRREQYKVERRQFEAVYSDLSIAKMQAEGARERLDKIKQGNRRLWDAPCKPSSLPARPPPKPQDIVYVQGEGGVVPITRAEAKRENMVYVETMPLRTGDKYIK